MLFNFTSIDIKGPMTMDNGKLVYILVVICLQTKYVELILLDSRLTSSFLSAANVIFSIYGAMLGTLSLKGTGLTETELSNTLRILSAFLNRQPYAVQFVSNSDKPLASGLQETSEIQFVAPISFQNPN